jgi:hypothetical protein
MCWDNHIKNVIVDGKPNHTIVIGKSVGKTLLFRLNKLGIVYTILPQPQGVRDTAGVQLEVYRQYQRICSRSV